MNRILLLGGSHAQIPAIKEAKRRNLYTILCDYLPDNPGRQFADEYHNVSTTDQDAVLALSKQKDIDHIFAYMSDPAVLTTAYVAENLGLQGNTTESISLLSRKDKFRKFMQENGFNTPEFMVTDKDNIHSCSLRNLEFPFVVKPVDSSDTKGVHKIDTKEKFIELANDAVSFSRKGKIIIEEYVDSGVANFHGDGFIIDGEMVFCLLGENLFFSDSSPLKPSSEIYPSRKPPELIQAVEDEVNRLIQLSGYRNGPVNIEVRVNSNNEIYIMEIGPRSGGGFTPQTICHATGFDMLKASFDYLEGKKIKIKKRGKINPAICFTLHTNSGGILKKIELDKRVVKHIVEKHLHVKEGDSVMAFSEANSNLGVIILKFKDFDEVDSIIHDLYNRMLSGIVVE